MLHLMVRDMFAICLIAGLYETWLLDNTMPADLFGS